MRQFIVTIKKPRNPKHDPANKQTGHCSVGQLCTDRTGAHHSFIMEAESPEDIMRQASERGVHVTRIEGGLVHDSF